MLFSYSAKSKEGTITEGVLDSLDRFSLARDLRSRGLSPLSINEKSKNFSDKFAAVSGLFSKVKVSEQIIFTKNLSGMILAGLSLSRAISVLQKQTKNPKLSAVLTSLSADINSGETFASGL